MKFNWLRKSERKGECIKMNIIKKLVIIAIIIFVAYFLFYSTIYQVMVGTRDERICKTKMYHLGQAIRQYSNDFGAYPTAEKWCDLSIEYVVAYGFSKKEMFKCSNIKKETCSYAINPNAEPNSPPDVALLFEAKGGWNQYGGPEIMSLENHKKRFFKNKRRGSMILFNDYHVRFIGVEDVNDLKWNVE